MAVIEEEPPEGSKIENGRQNDAEKIQLEYENNRLCENMWWWSSLINDYSSNLTHELEKRKMSKSIIVNDKGNDPFFESNKIKITKGTKIGKISD